MNKDLKGWLIHFAVWTFLAGGAYFMLKDHEKRITRAENRQDDFVKDYVLKADYKESVRNIWERLRRH